MKGVVIGSLPIKDNEEDWVANVMQQLHDRLSQMRIKSTAPLIPKNNLKVMVCSKHCLSIDLISFQSVVIDGITSLVDTQHRLHKLVKIQSLVRRYQARKRFKH